MDRIRWTFACFCVLLLIQIVRSVRRDHIRIEYSMAWLTAAAGLLALTLWEAALRWLSDLFGVPDFGLLLVLLAGLAFLFTLFRSSVDVSTLKDHSIVVGQKVGMLEWEIRRQRDEIERLRNDLEKQKPEPTEPPVEDRL